MQLSRRSCFNIASLAVCWLFCCAVVGAFGASNRRIEITAEDLFSRKEWNASQVDIAGLHLGMTREEANATVEKKGLHLMQYGPPLADLRRCSDDQYCFLSGSILYVDRGLLVTFSEFGRIAKLDIEVDREAKGELLKEFKGQTLRFVNGPYSDELRIRLIGAGAAVQLQTGRYGDRVKDTNYVYKKRGVVITVSPDTIRPGNSNSRVHLELTHISFIVPE